MQSEMDFFYHYNVFEYIQDFEIVFRKSNDAFVVFEVLNNDVCLYEKHYSKLFFQFVYLIKYKAFFLNNV